VKIGRAANAPVAYVESEVDDYFDKLIDRRPETNARVTALQSAAGKRSAELRRQRRAEAEAAGIALPKPKVRRSRKALAAEQATA